MTTSTTATSTATYAFSSVRHDPDQTVYRPVPGIIRRTIELPNMTIAEAPSATSYDVQREQITSAGPQLVRDATRVMVAIPVRVGNVDPVRTVVLDFAVAADGTPSQIDLCYGPV